MKNIFGIAAILLVLLTPSFAQTAPKSELSGDITGLYSFLHEGEFVQIEVNDGKVTGLVSRFKSEDPEKPEFVDQFFDQARLDGITLTFRTKPSDGVWFEFSGMVERGPAKTPADEGYWNIRGKLTEHRTAADGKVTQKLHQLVLKSFPQDSEPNPAARKDKKE
jgi:hypothetical protein